MADFHCDTELVELELHETAEIVGGDAVHLPVPICIFPRDPLMPQIPPVLMI